MDMLSCYLSDKIEHITSSLYSHILLWADKLAHSPNNPKETKCNGYCDCCNTYFGLETLVRSDDKKLPRRIVHCYNKASTATTTKKSESYFLAPLSKLMWSSSSSPPAVRTIMLGDLIGAESGDYMSSDLLEEQMEVAKMEDQSENKFNRRESRSARKREIPPLISLMRETGRMAWSFKKEYNEYGRLIISVERVGRKEYMEACRENCRLTMKLVDEIENNGSDCCEECGWPIDEEESDTDEEEMENENGRCMDLHEHECGEVVSNNSESFWIGDATTYLGQPSSAPLHVI